MNLLAPPRARVAIEVVFDLVCPWCFLGSRRLRRMLRNRPDLSADIIWRPFLLHPDLAPQGVARQDYLARKFGGEERARRVHGTMAELGRQEGIAFRFDRIRRIPHSLDAHRLVRWAARFGAADCVVDALFQAYFTAGADLGDPSVLAAIAAGQDLDAAAARRFLSSARGGGGGPRRQPPGAPPRHQRRALLRDRRPPRHRRRAGAGGAGAPARRGAGRGVTARAPAVRPPP